jgi:RNA polymerase sigma-70 factor (ECF subfamily)
MHGLDHPVSEHPGKSDHSDKVISAGSNQGSKISDSSGVASADRRQDSGHSDVQSVPVSRRPERFVKKSAVAISPDTMSKANAKSSDQTTPQQKVSKQEMTSSQTISSVPVSPKPAQVTDEQLLEAYRSGDRTGFTRLVERYQRELFHFLVRFVGDRAAAEDIFQESFLQVHQSAHQFDLTRRFRPWLFTIAANKARDYLRSQARRPANQLQASIAPGNDDSGEFIDLLTSGDLGPDKPMERHELQQLVQKTVSEMPANFREILLLSYFHQFSYKQIGEILEIPLGTVKSRLHAAVAFFADRWRLLNQGTFDS